jgi:hypothetical protein
MAVIINDGKVGKEEKKEVTTWLTRINHGEKFRDADNRKVAWTNMKKYYRNQFAGDIMSVPLIYSHGRQMIPFLYFKNPVVECTPLQRGFGHKAKILEAVDNMLIREMRVKEQLKLIIQDAYLYDYGIRKVGYDSEFGYDATGSLWKELFDELGIELTKEEAEEYNTYIISEFPFFLRVPPKRFIVDPDVEGPTLDTARWVIEEFYRPLEDVLDDDRYHFPKNLTATHMINKDSSGNTVISPNKEGQVGLDIAKKSDIERVKMWEIWDKKNREVMILADGHYGFGRRVEDVWNLQNFFPYDRLCFNPMSDEHYSVSDAMYVEKQQIEYNDTVSQEMTHRRHSNRKILAREGAFSAEQKKNLLSGKADVLVETQVPVAEITHLTPSMSRDIYQARGDIRTDMMETLAMGRNQMSQEMGKRKTASEAMIINQYTELRSDERRDIVADFIERAIQDVNTLVFKFWDVPDVIELVGQEGEAWAEWTGADLEGRYAVQIVPNSVMPHTKEQYKQKVEHLYSIVTGNPFVNLKEMTRLLFDAYEEFDTEKLILKQQGEAPSMADFRPGQAKMQDDAKPQPEGQINLQGSPEGAMAQGQREIGGEQKGGKK